MQKKPTSGSPPRTGFQPDDADIPAKDKPTEDGTQNENFEGLAFEAADWFAAGVRAEGSGSAPDPDTRATGGGPGKTPDEHGAAEDAPGPDWLERDAPSGIFKAVVPVPNASPDPASDPASDPDSGDPVYFDRTPVRPLPSDNRDDDAGSVMTPNDELGFLGRGLDSPPLDTPVWLSGEEEREADAEPESTSGRTPESEMVLKLAKAMGKAVKATQLYPLDNPICARFANELIRKFEETFALMGDLRLTVGKTKFFFRGEVVLEQPGREDSVPGRFFWDGVRELTFHQGLSSQEIMDFLSLCRKNHETAADGEDDIVTLLWQKQFEHIAYIAVDDILDLENPDDPIPEEFGKDFMNFVDLDMHNLEDEEDLPQVDQSMAEEIRSRLLEEDSELFGITAEERAELQRELEDEDSPRLLEDVFHILLETLFLDPDENSFVEMVETLATGLVELVRDGRLVLAGTLVRLLSEVRDERTDISPRMREAIDRGLAHALDPETVMNLVARLNDQHVEAVEGLESFVNALPQEVTPTLCEVLAEIENPRARRLLVDLMVRRARAGVDLFIGHLQDPRVELVLDMACILGRTRIDKAVKPLKGLMRHADERVRVGALEALTELGPAKAGDVVMRALSDADPKVRGAALKSLGRAGRVAVPSLIQIIDEPEFSERPFAEKKSVFRALGSAGGEDLVTFMEGFLVRKGLFRRGFDDEMRACACEALGWVGGRQAMELLEKHIGDKSSTVRSAALAGIRRATGINAEDDSNTSEEHAA